MKTRFYFFLVFFYLADRKICIALLPSQPRPENIWFLNLISGVSLYWDIHWRAYQSTNEIISFIRLDGSVRLASQLLCHSLLFPCLFFSNISFLKYVEIRCFSTVPLNIGTKISVSLNRRYFLSTNIFPNSFHTHVEYFNLAIGQIFTSRRSANQLFDLISYSISQSRSPNKSRNLDRSTDHAASGRLAHWFISRFDNVDITNPNTPVYNQLPNQYIVKTSRITAMQPRNTALFDDHTICISTPEIIEPYSSTWVLLFTTYLKDVHSKVDQYKSLISFNLITWTDANKHQLSDTDNPHVQVIKKRRFSLDLMISFLDSKYY